MIPIPELCFKEYKNISLRLKYIQRYKVRNNDQQREIDFME